MERKLNIWLVSREYAGIAEAGGVKNVACSLAETLVSLGHKVTLFIPLYKCTILKNCSSYNCYYHHPVHFSVEHKEVTVSFSHGTKNNVEIVFIGNSHFIEKQGVYTYTQEEEEKDFSHKKGEGHLDSQYLNTLFQKAVAYYGLTCSREDAPDIVHCQDATAALVPFFIEYGKQTQSYFADFYRNTKSIVTIHNAGPGYHHEFSSVKEAEHYTSIEEKYLSPGLLNGKVEPFLLSASCASFTTVSPEYAKEILEGKTDTAGLSQEFSKRNIKITGITNGIDAFKYSPENPEISLLPYSYSPENKDLKGKILCRNDFVREYASPLSAEKNQSLELTQYGYISPEVLTDESQVFICYHGRVVHQKGIDILAQAAQELLEKNLPVNFIFAGQGFPALERLLSDTAEKYSGKCVYLKGYNQKLARLSVAAADFSLHPSYFEPCGLEDFIAQILGTIPVANATGGLCKIVSDETGYLYSPNTKEELAKTLYSLIKIKSIPGENIFLNMISYAAKYVKNNFSWKNITENGYIPLYKNIMASRKD